MYSLNLESIIDEYLYRVNQNPINEPKVELIKSQLEQILHKVTEKEKVQILYYLSHISEIQNKPNEAFNFINKAYKISHADTIYKQFKKMKNTAILINTARGEVVDDEALISALRENQIAAVGLDVFNDEPNINPGLLKFQNAILLPHLGSATQETREAMGFRVLDNIADFFEGKVPRDRIA